MGLKSILSHGRKLSRSQCRLVINIVWLLIFWIYLFSLDFAVYVHSCSDHVIRLTSKCTYVWYVLHYYTVLAYSVDIVFFIYFQQFVRTYVRIWVSTECLNIWKRFICTWMNQKDIAKGNVVDKINTKKHHVSNERIIVVCIASLFIFLF